MLQVSGAETIFKEFFLISKYYLNMSTLLKTNLRGTNFPEFCEFWPILPKSIPKNFLFRVHLQKLIPAKKFFRIHFPKLLEISRLNYRIFNEKALYIH